MKMTRTASGREVQLPKRVAPEPVEAPLPKRKRPPRVKARPAATQSIEQTFVRPPTIQTLDLTITTRPAAAAPPVVTTTVGAPVITTPAITALVVATPDVVALVVPPISYQLTFTVFLNSNPVWRSNKLGQTAALDWEEEEASYRAWIRQHVGEERWLGMRVTREKITALIQTMVSNKKTTHFEQDIHSARDWATVVAYLEAFPLRGTISVVVDARFKDLNYDPAIEPAATAASRIRNTTTNRRLNDTANRQIATRAAGENPNQEVAEKSVCQSVSCHNYQKTCWVEKRKHYPLVAEDLFKWGQLWNRGEDGVDGDTPPREVVVLIVKRETLREAALEGRISSQSSSRASLTQYQTPHGGMVINVGTSRSGSSRRSLSSPEPERRTRASVSSILVSSPVPAPPSTNLLREFFEWKALQAPQYRATYLDLVVELEKPSVLMTYEGLRLLCQTRRLDTLLPIVIPPGVQISLLNDMNAFKARQKALKETAEERRQSKQARLRRSPETTQNISMTQAMRRLESLPRPADWVSSLPHSQFDDIDQLPPVSSPLLIRLGRPALDIVRSSPPVQQQQLPSGSDTEGERAQSQEPPQDGMFTQEVDENGGWNDDGDSEGSELSDEYWRHPKAVHTQGINQDYRELR